MNTYAYQKVNNLRIFSPRAENTYRRLKLNNKNNIGNYNEYSQFPNSGNSNPINLYYSPKNISIPEKSKIPRIYSPLHRKLNKLYRSSSQNNYNTRPLSCNSRALPSVQSFSYIKTPKSKYKKTKNKENNNYFNIEKEKLYQETYQIKKVVNILTKKLSSLKKENSKRENLINKKQKKINDIILNNNNDSLNENNYLNINNKNNNKNYNNNNINNSLNDYNTSINNISINTNINLNNNKINSPTPNQNLCIKIKKAIAQINNEIKIEKEKYEKIKKSLFLTKMNELKTESILLEEQINKINSFINKAFLVQEDNNKKKNEYLNLKDNIDKQKNIIKNLNERFNLLNNEKNELKEKLENLKKNVNLKNKKININKSKLNILIEKNNDLSNNKNLFKQKYTIKINSEPIEIKSFYTSQISKLNKLINFFTAQCKYSDKEIQKLKDKRLNLIGSNPENTEKKKNQKDYELFSIKNKENLSEMEKINNLKETLKNYTESEKKMKKKLNLYLKKLKELENPKDPDDFSNKSQIEFGIDNDNPYYTDDENNIPEKSNKFTSSQFNQFTYILFKSFESKGISLEESKSKLIDPFLDFNKNYTISNITYPSKEFDLIVNGYTKIIMEVLNCNNSYNSALIKIFIGALFYNSESNINKLFEYFNVLFSYTRNYSLEEEKYINKLQNKYKEQTEKLILCIKENILNETNLSKYIHLLKMKQLLENNDINLKDKYIEFLFYYMKKFDDPEAKLGDLKYILLNDIIPFDDFENNHNNSNSNSNNKNIINEEDKNNKIENQIEIIENSKSYENKENEINNKEKEKEKDKDKEITYDDSDNRFKKNDKKSVTEDNFSKKSKKHHTHEKDNSDDLDDDEDSMTEITNEEYVKQLMEAISLINGGLKQSKNNFNDLMTNVVQKRKINGKFYECITIEDFNEQLKSINVVLSDLKLSCLCSKYSIPNELRLIDKIKIENDIIKHIKGILQLEEEEDKNNNMN